MSRARLADRFRARDARPARRNGSGVNGIRGRRRESVLRGADAKRICPTQTFVRQAEGPEVPPEGGPEGMSFASSPACNLSIDVDPLSTENRTLSPTTRSDN